MTTDIDLTTKVAIVQSFLHIIDKDAKLRLLQPNYTQRLLVQNWTNRLIIIKSRQLGCSTFILSLFFVEAMLIPGLTVAVVSHEDYATKRLLDKLDVFHRYLPDDIRPQLYHNSDHEKSLPNGSTIYIGTAGARAFGRGDTIHRCLVSEEAHYANAEKLLSGLAEAVPMGGYLIRETTPAGDSGYTYNSVQACIEGNSNFKLLPLYWWFGEDYRIPRGDNRLPEEDRGDLVYTAKEAELVFSKHLSEDQIRWMRWKIRDMVSESKENIFPQEYISDLETCFIGPKTRVFDAISAHLELLSLGCREPTKKEDIIEIWKEPEPLAKYIFWVDPCGGEAVGTNDPHEGVILKIHAGGLEHIASIYSVAEQRVLAEKVVKWATKYNNALLVVERNGVGKGVLNYVVDQSYKNIYMDTKPDGTSTGKWGWYTTAGNKATMVDNCIDAIKHGSVITYDRKLIRQLRALVYKDNKIIPKGTRDDRAMAFMGAITVALQYPVRHKLFVTDYVSFR